MNTTGLTHPTPRDIMHAIETMGAAALLHMVKAAGRWWGAVQRHLYVLERKGRVKPVKIGLFTYYFLNPRAAAPATATPDSVSLEDREKIKLPASGA